MSYMGILAFAGVGAGMVSCLLFKPYMSLRS